MRDYKFTLGAGEGLHFAVTGDFVRCIAASEDFKIHPDTGTETLFKAQLGYKVEKEFESIYIETTIAQTITLMIGKGIIFDNRLAGQIDLDGALEIISSGSNSWDVVNVAGTGARVALLAAATTRREMLAEVKTQPATFYPAAAGGVGKTIAIGGYFALNTGAAVYVDQAIGGTVEVITESN